MNEIFADTGYFIAILSRHDQYRESALRAADTYRGVRIVTTEMVLVELFAAASREGPQTRAEVADFLQQIRSDPNFTIIPQTPEQFDAAAQLYSQRLDQRYSLTDCASFLAMQERGITHALTFDIDFQTAGFMTALA